jgi:hypothetical protein
MMIGDFPCQWGACSATFILEYELFMHLKDHVQSSKILSCEWRMCKRATVYNQRGYLSDHIISHMSGDFVSIYCLVCRTGYRNRQALSRHQIKSTCSGFYHGNDVLVSPINADKLVEKLVTTNSTLSLELFDRGRSLDEIIEQEMKGIFILHFNV